MDKIMDLLEKAIDENINLIEMNIKATPFMAKVEVKGNKHMIDWFIEHTEMTAEQFNKMIVMPISNASENVTQTLNQFLKRKLEEKGVPITTKVIKEENFVGGGTKIWDSKQQN